MVEIQPHWRRYAMKVQAQDLAHLSDVAGTGYLKFLWHEAIGAAGHRWVGPAPVVRPVHVSPESLGLAPGQPTPVDHYVVQGWAE